MNSNTNSIDELSYEELQKEKLKTEILLLKKPIWKQTSFISIIVTILVAFSSASIAIWQKQKSDIEAAVAEKKKYELMMETLKQEKDNLKEKTTEANTRYFEALAEKAIAISEKAEIKNQINAFQDMQVDLKRVSPDFEISYYDLGTYNYNMLKNMGAEEGGIPESHPILKMQILRNTLYEIDEHQQVVLLSIKQVSQTQAKDVHLTFDRLTSGSNFTFSFLSDIVNMPNSMPENSTKGEITVHLGSMISGKGILIPIVWYTKDVETHENATSSEVLVPKTLTYKNPLTEQLISIPIRAILTSPISVSLGFDERG